MSPTPAIINRLTLPRATFLALLTLLLGCSLSITLLVQEPSRITNAVDFPAFYAAGRIVNEYPRGSLYNPDLQRQLYLQIAPLAGAHSNLYFAYSPFFALVFVPLARLGYVTAFFCWFVISLLLFTAGFRLVWEVASLPPEIWVNGFFIAIAFLPFYFLSLFIGQSSAFGFFWLALTVYLERKGYFVCSGLSLALLLYKPTLLFFVIPMLFLTRRWKTVLGFFGGSVILLLVSIMTIGTAGLSSYWAMLATFSKHKVSGLHPLWIDVDVFSFFLQLLRGQYRLALVLLITVALLIVPILINAWRKAPDRAWIDAITWTLILNLYVVIHDSTLIIIPALLSIGIENKMGQLSAGLRWLLLALFVIPWFARQTAGAYGFQPMTVILFVFGCYELWLTLKRKKGQSLQLSVHE